MPKKVALLTTFFESESGYSLISVAETQIRMMLDHGYDPAVLVQEDFREPETEDSVWRSSIVDLRKCVPFMHLSKSIAKDFEKRVSQIQAALEQNLADIDVCITHDIILQDSYREHNIAMRRYAKTRPDLLWLHLIHSCPTPTSGPMMRYDECRHTPPPGYIVYPNEIDKPRVCQTYGLGGHEWKVQVNRASHSIDPLLIWPYDGLTKDLARKIDLLSGELTAVYPARLDRGKQPEKIIRLMAGIAKVGYEPRLLIIDWQSTGERFQKYIDELQSLSIRLGLSGKVGFTSRMDDRCSQGVPRHVVLELMDLCNLYIHPSRIETYSLVIGEAMGRGCLCVLNHDLPVMRELWGDSAIYMDFGSDRVNRDYPQGEQTFWNDEALRLLAEFKQNRAQVGKTRARMRWTPQKMWREFEPLLYLAPVGE
jgi:glycosyltransferase involved in cell wall biosynthesis